MDPKKNDQEVSHLPTRDIQAVAERIKQLPAEDAMEASLSLLTMLQSYLWRFEAATKSADPKAAGEKEVANFLEFVKELRDALLGP